MRRPLAAGALLWLLLVLVWGAGRLAVALAFGSRPSPSPEWVAQALAAASAQWVLLGGWRRPSSPP